MRVVTFALAGALVALPAMGQDVISAQSGLINYVEGKAYMGTEQVRVKVGQYPTIKEKAELRTEAGRAEVLLTPGAWLRMGEDTAIRMLDNRLTNTEVEMLNGSVVVESNDLLGDRATNQITLVYQGIRIALRRSGLYRVDTEPAQLRVYEGEAEVSTGTNVLAVKKGRLLPLTGAMISEKFDPKVGDPLARWAERRAEAMAMANISAAKRERELGSLSSSSRWVYNRYFGMLTFIPGSGIWNSPYGFRYYSPYDVYRVYQAPPVYRAPSLNTGWGAGGGPAMISRPSSGYGASAMGGGGMSASPSAPSTAAASAPSAPVSRGEGRAGGGGR